MRSIERLEKQRQIKENKQKFPPPTEDEMEEEMDFPKFIALNSAKSIFDADAANNFGGINTAPSVFDKTAAIKTNK